MKKQFMLIGLLLVVLSMGLSSCIEKITGNGNVDVTLQLKNQTNDTIVFFQKSSINVGFTDTVKIVPYTNSECYYGYQGNTANLTFQEFIVAYIDLLYFKKGTKVIQDGTIFSSHPNYTVEKFVYQKGASVIYTVTLNDQFFQ